MNEYPEQPVKRERNFLIIALIVLLIVFLTLLYLYLTWLKPVQPLVSKKPSGLTFLFQIFGPSKDDLMKSPHDVAADKKGNIYVTDTINNRILIFNNHGKFLRAIRGIFRPLGIDVAPNGDILVAFKRRDRIAIFSPTGRLKKTYQAFIPLDVAYYKKKIYVTTIGPIVVFDSKGQRELWGQHGREEGNFAWPNGIAIAKDGTVYVADTENLRLQAIGANGKLKWVLGKPPTKAQYTEAEGRAFGNPSGITVDEDGNIYVVDAFRDRIYLFSKNKKLLAVFGGERGDAEGQFDHPSGIAYGGDGIIYVVDKFNSRVQAFRVARPWKVAPARILSYWCLIVPLILLLLALLLFMLRRRLTRSREIANQPPLANPPS